jgi:pantoate--beta-alanine ligase
MGALHAGHRALIDRMHQECDFAAVSIFVNPTQFGPNEDLACYPRPLEADLELCAKAGVDVVFLPEVEEMYPAGATTTVDPGPLGNVFEGAVRPGHFRGVATVVLKLLNIVQPDKAYFGEKDFQQLCVIRQLVRDFDLPVEIVPCPTVREPDGLALSSRNVYLSPAQRTAATALSQALSAMRQRFLGGTVGPAEILAAGHSVLDAASLPLAVDYLALVDPQTMAEAEVAEADSRAIVAARLGTTRLIDNLALFEQAGLPQPRSTLGAQA